MSKPEQGSLQVIPTCIVTTMGKAPLMLQVGTFLDELLDLRVALIATKSQSSKKVKKAANAKQKSRAEAYAEGVAVADKLAKKAVGRALKNDESLYDALVTYEAVGSGYSLSKDIMKFCRESGKLPEYRKDGKSIWTKATPFWAELFAKAKSPGIYVGGDNISLDLPKDMFLPVMPGLTMLLDQPEVKSSKPGVKQQGRYMQVVDTRVVSKNETITSAIVGLVEWEGTRDGYVTPGTHREYHWVNYLEMPMSMTMWYEKPINNKPSTVLTKQGEKEYIQSNFAPGTLVKTAPDVFLEHSYQTRPEYFFESCFPRRSAPAGDTGVTALVSNITTDPVRGEWGLIVEFRDDDYQAATGKARFSSFEVIKEEIKLKESTKKKLQALVMENINLRLKQAFFGPLHEQGVLNGVNRVGIYRKNIINALPNTLHEAILSSESEAEDLGLPLDEAEIALHVYPAGKKLDDLPDYYEIAYNVEVADTIPVIVENDKINELTGFDIPEIRTQYMSWIIGALNQSGLPAQVSYAGITVSVPLNYMVVAIRNHKFIETQLEGIRQSFDGDFASEGEILKTVHRYNVFLGKKYFGDI